MISSCPSGCLSCLSRTPSSRTGLQRYYFFLSLQIFSQLFSDFFSRRTPQAGPGPLDSRSPCLARSCATPAPGRIFSGARRKRLSPAQTGKRPEKKSRHRTDAQLPREEIEAPGRSSMRSTGGTQSRDATATHMGKCWPDGECRPNIKKGPDRNSGQAPYHIRTSRSMYVITSCRPFRLPELQQVPSPESLRLRTQWSGTSRQLKPHSQGQLGKPW